MAHQRGSRRSNASRLAPAPAITSAKHKRFVGYKDCLCVRLIPTKKPFHYGLFPDSVLIRAWAKEAFSMLFTRIFLSELQVHSWLALI